MKQQQLVTIRLKVVMGGPGTEGQIQEHLQDYLDDGWKIVSVSSAAPLLQAAVNPPLAGWRLC